MYTGHEFTAIHTLLRCVYNVPLASKSGCSDSIQCGVKEGPSYSNRSTPQKYIHLLCCRGGGGEFICNLQKHSGQNAEAERILKLLLLILRNLYACSSNVLSINTVTTQLYF